MRPDTIPLRRNRDFVLLTAGQLFSSTGSSFTTIAYPLLVLALTNSPAKAGLVAFARLLPSPLLGLAAGLAADRWDRRRIMLAADAVRALAIGALAVVVAAHPVYWAILVVAFCEGAGDAFFTTAQTGAVRAVVPAQQLPAAIGVQQGRTASVGLFGPPLGGVLFGVGRAVPFVADAVSYVCSFVALLAMRTPFQQERESSEPGRLRDRLAEGWRFLWHQPFVRATSFLYGIGNFTIPGILFVLVVIARRQGLSGSAIGVLLAAFGACILLGSVLSGVAQRLLPIRAILLMDFYLGIACVAFVVRPNVYVLAVAILPQAIALPITDSVVHGHRIAITPDHLQGRVEAVRMVIARTSQPFGPLVAGLLLAAISSRATIAVFAACAAALAVLGTLSAGIRSVPSLD